jgi:ferredoxin
MTNDIEEATIKFCKSDKTATWYARDAQSLLQFAESQGLKPDYGCRSGACGTCETKLIKGQVHGPEGDRDGTILICSSMPASAEIELDL